MNTPGAGKCIVFDVKGDIRAIAMTTTELTTNGVLAALREKVPSGANADPWSSFGP